MLRPTGSRVPPPRLPVLRPPTLALALGTLLSLREPPAESPATLPGAAWTSVPGEAELGRVRALVVLAQGGDREAYAQLYDRYVDTVYRYLYLRTGSAALAEDLTSETFLRALRKLDSFVWQGRDVVAWFLAIARHLLLDHYKSSAYRLEITTADMLDADRPDEGIEDRVVAGLEATELLAALRQLRPEQQECLTLRFLQGLSVAEAAQVMDRSEGAIKQLQLRAVRALSRRLVNLSR